MIDESIYLMEQNLMVQESTVYDNCMESFERAKEVLSLHDDKTFALNVFSAILNTEKIEIVPHYTDSGVGYQIVVPRYEPYVVVYDDYETDRYNNPKGYLLDPLEEKEFGEFYEDCGYWSEELKNEMATKSSSWMEQSGIYVIYLDDEPIYIGQSESNVKQRIVRFLKEAFGRSRNDENHPGAEKYREDMKRQYIKLLKDYNGNIPESFFDWLKDQKLYVSFCPIDKYGFHKDMKGEYKSIRPEQRSLLDEFVAGSMKKTPKYNSRVQLLSDNQLWNDSFDITNEIISEELNRIIYRSETSIEMEKHQMTTNTDNPCGIKFPSQAEYDVVMENSKGFASSLYKTVLNQVLSLGPPNTKESMFFLPLTAKKFSYTTKIRKAAREKNIEVKVGPQVKFGDTTYTIFKRVA
jgi:hypothetical protein